MKYNYKINKFDIIVFDNIEKLKDFLKFILKKHKDKKILYHSPIWINNKIWIYYWIFDK